jgi:hypothetical protein
MTGTAAQLARAAGQVAKRGDANEGGWHITLIRGTPRFNLPRPARSVAKERA